MSLSNSEIAKLDYRAKIEWARTRIYELQSGFVNPSVVATQKPDPDKYLQNLSDLRKKAQKINDRIDTVSAALRIPINKEKDADTYNAVLSLDPDSGGEYVSYTLYKNIVEETDAGNRNLKLDDLIENSSDDIFTNSQLIQDRIYSGMASFSGEKEEKGLISWEGNTYLDKIVEKNAKDYLYKQVMGFVDNFLQSYQGTEYIPWAFKSDAIGDLTSIDGLKNLWQHYSDMGKQTLTDFGAIFKDKPALDPDPSLADYTNRFLDDTNKFLNDVNTLFNDFWVSGSLCCFTGFCVRLNTKDLQGIRSALSLLKCSINSDFNDISKSIKDIFKNAIKNVIIYSLINIIDQIKQRLANSLKNWIMNSDDPKWLKLYNCPPIKLLTGTYLNEAIKSIDRYFNSILRELYKKLELQKIMRDSKLTQAKHNQWICNALKAIDAVMKILALASVCGQNNSPSGDDVQKLIDNLTMANTNYVYPEESDPNIYNSFINQEQESSITESGEELSAAPTQTTNQNSLNNIVESSRADDCKRIINETVMPPSIVWTQS